MTPAAAPAGAIPVALGSMALAGTADELAAAVGIPVPADRSVLMLEAIRRLYHVPAGESAPEGATAGETLRAMAARARPPDAGADRLPLPLSPRTWTACVFNGAVSGDNLAPAILGSRKAALFYMGLAAMDAATLAWIESDEARVTRLYGQHAELLSTFGRSIQVVNGRVQVPGAPAAEALWERMVGRAPSDPDAFVDALLRGGEGRLAWLYDIVFNAPPGMRRHLLGEGAAAEAGLARLQALASVLANAAPRWKVAAQPMWRPLIDPAVLLEEIALDERGGLVGPVQRTFWESALAAEDLPAPGHAGPAKPASTPAIDATWLMSRVLLDDASRQRQRADQILYIQRAARGRAIDGWDESLFTVARGFPRFRSVALALERMGVDDLGIVARAFRTADAITRRPDALQIFEALLACVERARLVRAIDRARAAALVEDLLGRPWTEKTPPALAARDFLAAWVGESAADGGVEARLIDLLSGLARPAGTPARPLHIDWEGQRYDVDPAASEKARLLAVRASQQGVALDDGLALARLVADLSAAESRADAGRISELERLAALLERAEPRNRSHETLRRAARALVETRGRRDPRRQSGVARTLAPIADDLIGRTLVAIVYAAYLPSDQRELMAGRVHERHDFGTSRGPLPSRIRTPWQPAQPLTGDGAPWRLHGSLLSFDLALAPYSVRRLGDELPVPTLNASDRRTLMANVALLNPFDLTDADRDRIVALIDKGRLRYAAARSTSEIEALGRSAGISAWRIRALEWAKAQDGPDAASTPSLALGELLLMAAPDPVDKAALDRWGTPLVALTGQLGTRFPPPRPWEDVAGHSGSGLVATQFADLGLRTAQWLASAGLPAVLARGVLSVAAMDAIDRAPATHAGDFRLLVEYARSITAERFEDYVAALTVDGPLRPLEDGALP